MAEDVLGSTGWVTDGGLETDLLFNKGVDLPHFAAFPLVDDAAGRSLLEQYYAEYAAIAAAAGAGLLLETPTWRANPDWAVQVGYDARALDAVNRRSVELLRALGERADVAAVLVSGVVGPRGDGYVAGGTDADEAAEYHVGQVRSFARAGVDVVHAMTITEPAEALGVVRAARQVGVPVAVSFTVETDGRLPDGTPLRDAICAVDAEDPPDWYGVNCAHPTHLRPALDLAAGDEVPAEPGPTDPGPTEPGPTDPGSTDRGRTGSAWTGRIAGFRPNASTLSHAELDEMTELDSGDVRLLTTSTAQVRGALPALRIVGGCCGTDARHVAALWGVSAPARDH